MLWVYLSCAGAEPEPACEQTEALEAIAQGAECAPLWACCLGDPALGDVSCWYQSTDPALDDAPLVWQCSESLTNCESAPVDASEWACAGRS